MYLTERLPLASSALPVAELRAHLRIGTGFAEDTLQDDMLIGVLSAAFAVIERMTGRSLIERDFVLELRHWSQSARQLLPRAPVTEISGIAMRRTDGEATIIDPSRYRLDVDDHASAVRAVRLLPSIPVDGVAEVSFRAGYGPRWSDVPSDLAQATLMLAATRYEDRSGTHSMPHAVGSMIAPYRPLRVSRSA